jgi:hypothetical protein
MTFKTNGKVNPIEIEEASGAFGGKEVFQIYPYINLYAFKGVTERNFETYTSGTGSFAGEVDNLPGIEFGVSCGTSVGGYGVLRTKKVISYRPGIGVLARFTARFTSPVANSIQRAGLFNIGNELTFGYDGNNGFGILRKTGGRPEIRTLTITTAPNGNQTATITLNGVAQNVSLTNTSAAIAAYDIAQINFAGWNAYNIGNTVVFQSESTGSKAGTYSSSSTGNFAGTFSQTKAGRTETDTWIYQSAWNKDKLLSTDGSFTLDPTKGNIFQIQFQYLGYGNINFFVENPNTGKLTLVHVISYPNQFTRPSIDLPEFKLGIIAASAGSTTNLSVYSASMGAFHENAINYPGKIHGYANSSSGVGTTLTNVAALKKTTIANLRLHITDYKMVFASLAVEGTRPVQFEIRINPTFSAKTEWASIDEDVALVGTRTGGTVSGGELLYAGTVAKSSNIEIDMSILDVILSNDDVIAIATKATSGTADVAVSIVFKED